MVSARTANILLGTALLLSVGVLGFALYRQLASGGEVVVKWEPRDLADEPQAAPEGSGQTSTLVPTSAPSSPELDHWRAHTRPRASKLAGPDLDRFAALQDDAEQAEGDDIVPPEKRWQLEFEQGLSEGPYARQLDSIGVELATFENDTTLVYVGALSTAQPTKRTGKLADEKRIYLTWDRGDLVGADRVLMAKVGLEVADQVVLHFCSDETQQQLIKLERDFKNRDPRQILVTRFGLRRTFRGYELYVIDQVARGSND